MNSQAEVKKLKAEIKTLTRRLYRKVIAYYRACGAQLFKDNKPSIQMYSTVTFGIACNEDGSFRKVCSLTIKDKNGEYNDLVWEYKFKRGDWNPNKDNINE